MARFSGVVLFVFATVAHAQPVDSPRPFGSIGVYAGFTAGGEFAGPGAGLSAGLGAQLSDRIAISAQLRAATIVVLTHGATWAQFEYSPVDALSLGIGVGVQATQALIAQKLIWAPTVPLSFAINLPARREDGTRHGFRIGLDVALSADPTTGANIWGGLSFGGVWR